MIGLQDQGTRERTVSTSTTLNVVEGGDGDGCAYSQAVNKVNLLSYYSSNIECRYYSNGAYGGLTNCVSGITDAAADKPFYTNIATPSAAADPTGTIFFTITHKNIYRSSMSSATSLVWTKIGTVGSNGISTGDIRETFQTMGIGPTSTNQVAFAKDNQICITTNGGTSWTTVTVSNSISGWNSGASPVWASSTLLYLASKNPAIGSTRFIKSINTGSTWTAPNTGTNKLPDIPIGKLVVSSTDSSGNTVFAGTWIGVYITTDGGVNWNVLGSGLPNVVVSDMYQNLNNLYVSAYGRVAVSHSSTYGCSHRSITNTTASPTSLPTTRMPVSPLSIAPTSKPLTKSVSVPVPTLAPLTAAPVRTPTTATVCNVAHPNWIGDHYCDNATLGYNTAECNWDGGDCCAPTCGTYASCGSVYYPFVCLDPKYKNCNVAHPHWIGDHYCDNNSPGYNTAACNYDGGDCCPQSCGSHSTCGTGSYPFACIDPVYTATHSPVMPPTLMPSLEPTTEPSVEPTISKEPTVEPTLTLTKEPSTEPTIEPTNNPTVRPSKVNRNPTIKPSRNPTVKPSRKLSFKPTRKPTKKPV
eukprot:gene3341-6612_t